jgi:hypothetical protein
MTSETWLRIAAGLTAFLAIGHTFGAVLAGPKHGPDEVAVRDAMRNLRFKEMGVTRSYWDAYAGSGWTITFLVAGSAAVMWWLAPLVAVEPGMARPILLVLAFAYAGVTAVSARFFVTAPIVVSGLITLALAAAAFRLSVPG